MPKHKILIVDDDDILCMLVRMSLGIHFNVIAANDGQEAISLIQTEKPDLILLSVVNTDTKGLTILLKLREQTGDTHIPIILLTDDKESPETKEYLKLNPIGVITKPLNSSDLPNQITEIMTNHWPEKNTISVLVVDDVPLICDTVKILLTHSEHAVVIGEANDGVEAVKKCQDLKPDIVLMDVEMPAMNGIDAAKVIRNTNKEVKIIMLTAHDSDRHIFTSFAAGADGYILKNRFIETLQTAIATVRLGSVWLDPAIARRILALSALSEKNPLDLKKVLSQKEIETLNTVATCSGNYCLVEPQFVQKLHSLAPVT